MKAEVIVIMDNFTKEEIKAQMALYKEALDGLDEWHNLSEDQKDEAFEQAE